MPFEFFPCKTNPSVNILSVDLECWETIILREVSGQIDIPCYHCRDDCLKLLRILDKFQTNATFFVLGNFAETYPDLIREIDAQGHEIACHGYSHVRLQRFTEKEFRKDLELSLEILSNLIGKRILGYRAPAFSIGSHTPWFFDVLTECGIMYDSSVLQFTKKKTCFGISITEPILIANGTRSLIEIPVSTVSVSCINLPVSGGGYFRLVPQPIIHKAISSINKRGKSFVAYVHPYECREETLDFFQFASYSGHTRSLLKQIKYNLFRRSIPWKIDSILNRHRFTTFEEAYQNEFSRG
jgi:polysaccharide deacetylase family protein (PEP-CTERM system associated)